MQKKTTKKGKGKTMPMNDKSEHHTLSTPSLRLTLFMCHASSSQKNHTKKRSTSYPVLRKHPTPPEQKKKQT
jgi:hypothetical protein